MNKSAFMRRGQVVTWLMQEGLSDYSIRQLFTSGTIVALKLPGNEAGRSLYSRAQIQQDVLDPILSAGDRLKG